MKLILKKTYLSSSEKYKINGTAHIYWIDKRLHIRGVRFFWKQYMRITLPHSTVWDGERFVTYPIIEFEDIEEKREFINELKKEILPNILSEINRGIAICAPLKLTTKKMYTKNYEPQRKNSPNYAKSYTPRQNTSKVFSLPS